MKSSYQGWIIIIVFWTYIKLRKSNPCLIAKYHILLSSGLFPKRHEDGGIFVTLQNKQGSIGAVGLRLKQLKR